jgi:putative endonuclease
MTRFWVYIIASRKNGTLYVGVTSDLARRAFEHREAVVEGFTSRHSVKRLVWYEEHPSAEAAIRRALLCHQLCLSFVPSSPPATRHPDESRDPESPWHGPAPVAAGPRLEPVPDLIGDRGDDQGTLPQPVSSSGLS